MPLGSQNKAMRCRSRAGNRPRNDFDRSEQVKDSASVHTLMQGRKHLMELSARGNARVSALLDVTPPPVG